MRKASGIVRDYGIILRAVEKAIEPIGERRGIGHPMLRAIWMQQQRLGVFEAGMFDRKGQQQGRNGERWVGSR